MDALVREERGSVLIMTVIAMLIMGVLSVSFALLADVETKIGVNYKQQAQSEALAEAGLEVARDCVRAAVGDPQGFTSWITGAGAGACGNGPILANGVALGAGQYWARIDNDCAPLVPGAIQQPGPPNCPTTTDTNQTAILTAWAQAGTGRGRVRAIVGVDNPWKHVCSNAQPDNNGYCNEPGNRNGNPTVNPADPNDPNGPSAYTELPYPILGCSRVAPGVHKGPYALATQDLGCAADPAMHTHPYPKAPNVPPKWVVMGEDPGVGAAKTCNNEPAGGSGNVYFGYFDCALTTYCDPGAGDVCGAGFPGLRKGCLHPTDSRVSPGHPNQLAYNPGGSRYVAYDPATGQCGTGAANETGMVFIGDTNFSQNVGSMAKQVDVYVLDGNWSQGNNKQFYGTLVVEGSDLGGIILAVGNGNSTELWSGPNSTPAAVGWGAQRTYGYPLVALAYNPDLAPPTVEPTYAPQPHTADFGSSNTQIHGMIYSGGHVQFNPLSFDGSVVAFEIQTQGSATYTYNTTYGNNVPPAGFPLGSGNQVMIIRKSFIACVNYNDESGGATPCS